MTVIFVYSNYKENSRKETGFCPNDDGWWEMGKDKSKLGYQWFKIWLKWEKHKKNIGATVLLVLIHDKREGNDLREKRLRKEDTRDRKL